MKNQHLQSTYHAVSQEVGKFALPNDYFRARHPRIRVKFRPDLINRQARKFKIEVNERLLDPVCYQEHEEIRNFCGLLQ